jgi:hypothetical protein
MKQKTLPKSFIFGIASFSLAAFLFVNVHAGLNLQQITPGGDLSQPKVETSDDQRDDNVRVPDVTVLGRVLFLAHRFMENKR